MVERILTNTRTEDGQALAEYSLILALIAIICVAALILMGGAIAAFFFDFVEMIP
jgi:Flp pilus assembly pilin Flp